MFLQDVVCVLLCVAQSQPGAVAVVCHWRAQAPDMVDLFWVGGGGRG